MTTRDRVNILLVDDQPGKLLTYEAILGELDENLLKAASAREAFETLLRTEVAVVLIDVCMPDLDGFELAAMIREHPHFHATAIILISAVLVDDADRMKGYSSGAMDYLPVPVVPEILRAKVRVFVELFRKTRELEALNRDLEARVSARTAELEAIADRLRSSEEALLVESRRKDEFLAILAHELRNPMAPIRNATRALMLRGDLDADVASSLEIVDRQAGHLARLVDDLLDVARILSGKLALSLAPMRLEPVIASACEEIRPAAEAKGVVLDCRVAEPLPPVLGDATRLHQVLWNLLSNAVKFASRGGRVELDAAQRDSVVELAVRDDGAGIAPAFLPHVFEPFRQQDAGADRRHQGLGLGLSIVSQLVERHGGTVTAASDGPGRGACFTVRLPVAALAGGADATLPEPAQTLERLRVVVVDDDPIAREMMKTVLARAGAMVDDAASAREAFATVSTSPPDVLVSDLEMPGEDGFSLIRRIRALPPDSGGETPALALTAYAQPADRRAALDAGFQEHLAKPVDATGLIDAIGRLARR